MTSQLPPDLAGAQPKASETPASPKAAPRAAVPGPAPVPTGFPEPVTPDEPRPGVPEGMVRLATVPPMGSLTIPPLDDGGESVVITTEGADVDEETAERAREAARLAGLRLTEG